MNPTKRNPAGVDLRRPIALRLMPAERIDAERVAAKLNISLSNLARQSFLVGLPIIENRNVSSLPKQE